MPSRQGRSYYAGGEWVPITSEYVSGTAVACGTVSTSVTIPTGANNAFISARGAAVYYTINGTAASASASGGYIQENGAGYVFPISNLTALHVIGGGTAAVAHVQFYSE